MKKATIIIIILIVFFSCKSEVELHFNEYSIETSNDAIVAVNYPKANGEEGVCDRINQTLSKHIVNQIDISENPNTNLTVDQAIEQFNNTYNTFISDFPESSQKWEALIDGEVTYRSPEVICIAMNSYLDTGGAHGNTNVVFFNFNPLTGEQLRTSDLISNAEDLSLIIKEQLKQEVKSSDNASMDNIFLENEFKLPESIGYSDDGLIVLYNPYEIASYTQGIVEFSIPFDKVNRFLKIK